MLAKPMELPRQAMLNWLSLIEMTRPWQEIWFSTTFPRPLAPEQFDARTVCIPFEELVVGDCYKTSRTVTARDVSDFGRASGDTNPLHFDSAFAEQTIFKTTIAHGLLSASFISAVFGMSYPGPGAVYIKQELNFKAPVRIGDTVDVSVQVVEKDPKSKRVTFACECAVRGKVVLHGDAVIMVPA